LTTAVTLAVETGNEQEIREVKANWKETAANFWRSMASEEKPTPFQKLNRLKVLRWLAATWMQLLVALGHAWTAFVISRDEAERGDPLEWPSITLCIDQGSDGWSASFFLASLFINIIVLFDQSHRCWNDVQLAISDCGWWYMALLLIAIMNLDHGPWGGQRWFNEARDAVLEYVRVATRRCCLFQGSSLSKQA
jgi:hypothetical protein